MGLKCLIYNVQRTHKFETTIKHLKNVTAMTIKNINSAVAVVLTNIKVPTNE